jgi:hypothetical protein
MEKSTKRRLAPGDDAEVKPEPEDTGPKVTAVFAHRPVVPARRVPRRRNLYGRDVDHIEAEDPEAATEWDHRLWRRV